MKLDIKSLPKSQVEINIEVDFKEFLPYLEKAAQKISQDKKISGFRSGKGSIESVKQQAGEQVLLNQAAELALPEFLTKAAARENLQVVGQPAYAIENLKFNEPVKFKATVTLVPEVELGDYKNLKVKKLEEIKKEVRKNLEKEVEKIASQQLEDEMLKSLIKQTKFGEIPEILINTEVNRLVQELEHNLTHQGIKLEDHLQKLDKKQSDLMLEYAPPALERVKLSLVLQQLVKDQNIAVSDDEINKENDKLKKIYDKSPKALKTLQTSQHKEYLRSTLLYHKAIEHLKKFIVDG